MSGSYVTFGFGQSASLVATLGLHSPTAGGSYITLGYGQSASRAAMLGLGPASGAFSGSYVTLGQGQDADVYLRLGLYHGSAGSPIGSPTGSPTEPTPEPPLHTVYGRVHFVMPVDALRAQQLSEDELLFLLFMQAAASGALN